MTILGEKIVYAIRRARFDGAVGCREKDNRVRECTVRAGSGKNGGLTVGDG
jgi:hypothetical protein